MFCVEIEKEIVYATSDENRYVREVTKKYANVANAKLVKSDGTPIKFTDLKRG